MLILIVILVSKKGDIMRVLVTGATGFLGSALCKRLINEGHEVHILRRNSSDLSELISLPINHHIGDVTDKDSLTNSFQGMDCIFHLAGLIAYKASDRPAMEKVNLEGTKNVVDTCISLKIPKLVYLSSVVAIGASFSPNHILNEDSKYNIAHLHLGYFDTKHEAENYLVKAVQDKGLDAVMINPSTIYGAGDAKKGSRKTQVKVANGKFPIFPVGGVNIVALEDVLDAIIKVWEKGVPARRYIISGENITIQKLFEIIANAAGVEPPKTKLPNFVLFGIGYICELLEKFNIKGPISLENAYTSTMYHWFDNTRAKNELGLQPKSAEYAIKQSVNWMKDKGIA